ncbi:hypothetical protein ACJJTC_008245 [Scirpophaga incertulas]
MSEVIAHNTIMEPYKETVSVKTTTGPIRGYIYKEDGKTYCKFKKIPYAKPPLGPLRFKPPSPITKWTEELDCTLDAPMPIQRNHKGEIFGAEDCLYIELSTKTLTPSKLLPVMFWIGTYMYSVNIDNFLDPTLLNDSGVLFVRCGFRLGPFGFLSINEFTAPGNCGLKDIVMALKWVQNNIEKFGGDPNNVTIFGSSTGGSITHLMMLSPMAAGLFHKAIIQSSSAFNNWSLTKNPYISVIELAKRLSITKSHQVEIVEELRTLPAEDIVAVASDLQAEIMPHATTNIFDSYFKPCIEVDHEGLQAFLTKSPWSILKSGNFNRVPLIIGSNSIEGSVFQFITKDFYSDFEKYNEDIRNIVPKHLLCDVKLSKEIGKKLLMFYFGENTTLCEKSKLQYIQLISDYYFLYFVNKTVRLHCEMVPECPVFYYVVNCAGKWSVPEDLCFLSNLGHSTELTFIFRIIDRNSSIPKNGTPDSFTTRNRVIRMWTNFAKFGNPTPDKHDELLQIQWQPVENKEKLNYLNIDTQLTMGINPFHERMKFWDNLHKEYSLVRMLAHFNDMGVSW